MSGCRRLLCLSCVLLLSLVAAAQSDFTVVLLPDTQYYSETYPAILRAQVQWIVNNTAAQNIQLVLGLGDVVQTPSNAYEWSNADDAYAALDAANIPYFVNIGNHDYDGIKPGNRQATAFNAHFGPTRYAGKTWYGGNYNNSNENFYGIVTLGGQNFLILSLEYVPRAAVMSWAASVISAYPSLPVIVIEHNFTFGDNTRADLCDSNEPTGTRAEDQWMDVFRNYPNIFLILNGHFTGYSGVGRRSDLGVHGNIVHQMLSDYQEWNGRQSGYLRILHFRPSLNQISVVTYSPSSGGYLTSASHQFTLPYRASSPNPAGTGIIAGRARIARIGSTQDCQPLPDVALSAGGLTTLTSSTGAYSFSLASPAVYSISASLNNWLSQTKTVNSWTGFPADTEFFMVPQRGYVHGYVKTSSGTAISGVTIQVAGGMVSFNKKLTTDKYGFYSSGLVSIGNYTVSASKSGYTTQSKSAVVNNGTTTTVSFTF